MSFVPKYATGFAFSANELFTRFKLHYIKNPTFPVFKEHSKKIVAARVFIYLYYLIIKDIIDNGITFLLPSARQSYIEMNILNKEEFIKARKNGAYQEVDFLASDFKAYHLQYRYQTKSGKWFIKKIYVHKKLKNIITDNTNKGKQYTNDKNRERLFTST